MRTLRFHEQMSGWVSFDEPSYNQGMVEGRRAGNDASHSLEIHIDDLDRFLSDRDHGARVSGVFRCDALGGEYAVTPGSTFNLLVDAGARRRKRMLYRLFLRDDDGRAMTLSGFKEVEDDPGYDVWGDTTRLFVRLLSGHPATDPAGDELTIATGILHISLVRLLEMTGTFRAGGGLRGTVSIADFSAFFLRELLEVYVGRDETENQDDFPESAGLDAWWQGHPPEEWHDLPGHPGLRRRIIGVPALDDVPLTLHHIRGERDPFRGPVLLIHGGGVRANLFYGSPRRPTLVDALVGHGYDVWLENWRASIDLPARSYTLDQGAVYDHPAAVKAILGRTGANTLKAVVQCQGSTSLTMSAIAGLVPEITTIVTNAVSLHVNVPVQSKLKLHVAVPLMSLRLRGLDAQWAVRAPSALATGVGRWAHVVRGQDCDNEVCQLSNYIYGAGPDILWRHANLDPRTHEWVSREFGWCPFSLLRQIGRAQNAGHIVPVSGLPEIPSNLVEVTPKTDARFSFLAGTLNRLFLPVSQKRSFEHFDRFRPGYHTFHELPGLTHLDVLFGRNAARDVFPIILRELDAPVS